MIRWKRNKKKTKQDLSMFLFSHEEMSGEELHKEESLPKEGLISFTEEDVPLSDSQDHEPFHIDSGILTKDMFFAIRHLKRIDINQVRMAAMEMAMVWQNGKNLKETYTIQSIPDLRMDYHQFIAYYYCSFNMAFPNMVDKLQLPYEKEYQRAMDEIGATHGGVS
ncbi:MAG: hypothetical protein IKX24_01165 [Prevotella sp.]|nr:hypothetical protein [Prevotella sp.]